MQTKKADIRKRIMQAARREFLRHGYAKASLRVITDEAGCSLSNIYNYFKSKDDLFCALVQDRVDEIRRTLEWLRTFRMPADVCYQIREEERNYYLIISGYIQRYRSDLELLFLKSEGSSLENFSEEILSAYEELWHNYLEHLRANFSQKNIVSTFFVHNATHYFFNTLLEFLEHRIPSAQMEQYMDEIFRFHYYGYVGIIEN